MIRVAHVITDLDGGEATTVLSRLLEGSRRRSEPIVVARAGAIPAEIRELGIPIGHLGITSAAGYVCVSQL